MVGAVPIDIDNFALTPSLVLLDTDKELFLKIISKQQNGLKMFGPLDAAGNYQLSSMFSSALKYYN